jgi:hypothetical protein
MYETADTHARHTQAVVIIHGIGEQRPMETLRSFVDSVLPEPEQGGEKYYSKPDSMSKLFELRKLQDRSQPRTHFFEYYWAYQVEGTTFGQIRAWLATLLLRKPGTVPRALRTLWFVSWLLILVAIVAAAWGVGGSIRQFTAVAPLWVSGISAVLFAMIQGFVFLFVGDVARYLTPLPSNIKLRQAIRAEGINLLKQLHEKGEYERIVLVGHSLGSFIAYDILKHLWEEYKEEYKRPRVCEQEALAQLEEIGDRLQKGVAGVTAEQYANAQMDLWKEMRSLGNPWLVTDLITLGSPLAHAVLVLGRDEDDLHQRQKQRELPTCPPMPEIEKSHAHERSCYSYRAWAGYGDNGAIKLRAVHHGGLFAFTRWTNLYFPGDLAGGPITVFGPGISNIQVDSGKWFIDRTIRAHLCYWDKKAMSEQAKSNSLSALVQALDLKNPVYFD